LAGADTASNITSQRPGNRVDDFAQHRDRGRSPVELAPAVIGYDNGIGAGGNAEAASSASSTPFRMSFPGQRLRTIRHAPVADASNWVAIHSASV